MYPAVDQATQKVDQYLRGRVGGWQEFNDELGEGRSY